MVIALYDNKLNEIKSKLAEDKKVEIINFIDVVIRREIDGSSEKRFLNTVKSELE